MDKRKRGAQENKKRGAVGATTTRGRHDESCKRRRRGTKTAAFTWTGQFRPEWARAYLDVYALAGSCVWDPFVGSGTVLYECAARERVEAHGTDVNPAAVTMASIATCTNWNGKRRRVALDALDSIVAQCTVDDDGGGADVSIIQQDRLIARRPSLDVDVRLLADALLCRTEKVLGGASISVGEAWPDFRAFVEALPSTSSAITATLGDARESGLAQHSVDLVLTSPPYINVINYHQQYRGLMERLGWRVLSAAPAEIGANRKHRSNRLLTVIQYCLDMDAVLREMVRVCKPDARAILVVGRESKVAGSCIHNSRLVERLAIESGLWQRATATEERSFTNRFGRTIIEDIIHLRPAQKAESDAINANTPTTIAVDALKEAKSAAPPDKHALFDKAIAAARCLKPSPPFDVHLVGSCASAQTRRF